MIYEKENGNVGIEIENPPARFSVKGTTFQIDKVTTEAGSDEVTGIGTLFTVQVAAGDMITIGGETRTIIEVKSNIHLNVDKNFTTTTELPYDVMKVHPDILRVEDLTGEPKLVVSKKGNIGMGTARPNRKLEIKRDGNNTELSLNERLFLDGQGSTVRVTNNAYVDNGWAIKDISKKAFTLEIRDSGMLELYGTQTNGNTDWLKMATFDAPSNKVILNGKVGIGTPSPQAKLDVRGTITTSGSNIELTQQASGNRYSYIDFHGDDTYIDYGLRVIRYNSGANAESRIHHRGTGILRIYTQESGSHVVLQPRGNVGIGTIDPKEKLELNGFIRGNQSGALRISTGYGYVDIGPKNSDWSHFVTDRSKYYFNKEIRVSSGKIGSYAEDLSLCTSGTERIRVKRSNGNVGIGTSAPGAKLSINGGLHVGGESDPGDNNLLVDGNMVAGGVYINNNLYLKGDFDFPKNKTVKFNMGSTYNIDMENPKWEFIIGYNAWCHKSWYYKAFSLKSNGDLYCAGSKSGYVVDHFVNRAGDILEQGDVVVISKHKVSHYSGSDNNIPIPEVDLTESAYDVHVCGIVAKVIVEEDLPFVEALNRPQADTKERGKITEQNIQPYEHPLKEFGAEYRADLDQTKVQDKQMGTMVTLGAFTHCKVDADIASIEMGDLLTTSPTKGHAQKVIEPEKAIGAIIGKALGTLKKGKGKIPVLVILQ